MVDDTAAQRYSVVRALRAHGFDVVEAANGAEAIDVLRRTSLDAVVLDVHLPDIDGFELCRHLKEQSPTMLPVLHLSSVSISGDARIREIGRAHV